MSNKNYINNGVNYNLDNIWDYLRKDYWDDEDLKFDFWYRLLRHQEIFNEVMKINGLNKSNFNGKDNTHKIKEELIQKNKEFESLMIDLEWED